jgi:hypothetical protein
MDRERLQKINTVNGNPYFSLWRQVHGPVLGFFVGLMHFHCAGAYRVAVEVKLYVWMVGQQ